MELVQNVFSLLPDDNDREIEEFIGVVAGEARVTQEEEEKRGQGQKAEPKKQKQQEENQCHPAMTRAKCPVLSKSLYKSNIEKPAQEGKDQVEDVKEKGIADVFQDNAMANGYHQEMASHNRGYSSGGDNGYQGNEVGEGRYRRNYGRGNLYRENNGGEQGFGENNGGEQGFGGEGSYRRNYGRRNLYQENNGGEQGFGRERSYRRNYGRGDLYQESNGGKQGFVGDGNYGGSNFYQDNNGREEGYGAHPGGIRGRGRGRGRGFNENNNGSEDLVFEETQHVVKDVDGSVERQKNGDLITGDSNNGPVNGDSSSRGAEAADSNKEKKKKKKNKVNGRSNKKHQEEEKSPANSMTYQEYEKVLLEKKRALEAMVNSEKPRATMDKDFQSMQPIGKKKEGSSIKPNTSENNLMKKGGVANKDNAPKTMNIDEFLKPAKGKKSFASYGGRTRYQSERPSDEPGDINNDRRFSRQAPVPRFDDIVQFPSLGGEATK
ncbi:RGG repeats nuclear RNA binding protein A-like [Hevea brasiliensis]|uniref:RGG repeats nuclear RNA binding protein A-like n=1 Tax=Hevea brasiliensis TaxID=3981 RepID=UPI0025FF07EE|nr:RGG repeats nuclear RNA binding protein A-like [Hevea brasiliensis]